MLSKKLLILSKARAELEKRIEQGENIQFNFNFNDQPLHTTTTTTTTEDINNTSKKRRRLTRQLYTATDDTDSDYEIADETDEEDSMEDDEEYKVVTQQQQQPVTTTTTSTTAKKTSTVTPRAVPQRGRRNSNAKDQATSAQPECCIIGCDNVVTNRLRYSLRCHTEEDFKPNFLEQGWHKICHYHYFSDLYQYKKSQKSGAPAQVTSAKRRRKSNASPPALVQTEVVRVEPQHQQQSDIQHTKKRSRDEYEASNVTAAAQILQPIIVRVPVHHTSISNSSNHELQSVNSILESFGPKSQQQSFHRCSTVHATTPVKKKDASAFFNFIEQSQRVTM